jgi:hypothetical protein
MAWGTEGTGATAYGNIVELPIKVQQPPAQPQKDEDAILREALTRLGYKKQETTDNSGL